MAVFTLKVRDTRPILEVVLRNPDGTVHDLTGTTDWKLHIRISPNLVITRTMVKQGADTLGTLRYTWLPTDWDAGNLPAYVRAYQPKHLEMEYEVISGTDKLTFPNSGYDLLKIIGDVVVVESQGVLAVTLANATCSATATVS